MYVFIVGMERCGTHSAANIIDKACKFPHYVVHEEPPFLCREAKLLFEKKDFRTKDLKSKVGILRSHHKGRKLVCEANHRLCYFITFLAREFPDCKIIFLYRDPISTIISRISIWAHYPEYLDMYPQFYRDKVAELEPPYDFNKFRITPPNNFNVTSIIDLYLWEWMENYRFSRKELTCIPQSNRFLMAAENLTLHFDWLLGFIDWNYFEVNDEVIGWSRVKSDSVYVQKQEIETDVFVTRNRNPDTDETIKFAQQIVAEHKKKIVVSILSMMAEFATVDLEDDIMGMDRWITQFLKVKNEHH